MRVLIVDDSRTMRHLIRTILNADPRLTVVAEAGTAREARDAVNQHRPDVMTLDVEMPNMSGLEFLRRLMRHRPMPVVMVSTLTKHGSDAAVEAMALGAVDCVEKPKAGKSNHSFTKLSETVVLAACARVRPHTPAHPHHHPQPTRSFNRICLIGGSTGAVEAIERTLQCFPENCPPTLITQHMPAPFLASFATRLNSIVRPIVRLATDGEHLQDGQVLIAPGGDYHLNLRQKRYEVTHLLKADPVSGHRPSVDSMFMSAQPIAQKVVAGLLTGMGRDGAEGMKILRDSGAHTLAQTKETCVVFGMPRVAGELGGVEHWADLDVFGEKLLKLAEIPIGQNR